MLLARWGRLVREGRERWRREKEDFRSPPAGFLFFRLSEHVKGSVRVLGGEQLGALKFEFRHRFGLE